MKAQIEKQVKFADDDNYVCGLADRLEPSMREAYNAEVALSALLFGELRSLMKKQNLDSGFVTYWTAREKYVNAYYAAEQAGKLESFKMAVPTPPKDVKELAIDFKKAAKAAAHKFDFQPQWIQKNLMGMDDELFRERSAGAGGNSKTTHPRFRQEQIDYVKKIVSGLRLTSEQIEAIVHALA